MKTISYDNEKEPLRYFCFQTILSYMEQQCYAFELFSSNLLDETNTRLETIPIDEEIKLGNQNSYEVFKRPSNYYLDLKNSSREFIWMADSGSNSFLSFEYVS